MMKRNIDRSHVVFAILNNKENVAKVLMSTRTAVKECREYVSEMMINDGVSKKQINGATKLLFSLKMNVNRKIVSLLISRASTQDIVDLVVHWKSSLRSND